jgi:uncharacterized protein YbjT (DUF2867 family)
VRVGIAGGHGKIAMRLTRLLADRGDEVRSLIRNPDHEADIRQVGGEPVICDLEQAQVDEVAEAVRGVDAVVFAAGAGPGSGEERKWTMDYGGAVKLIEAAKADGIDRYVMISSRGADPNAEGEGFAVYLRAKGKADEELMQSGLAYTIVRPVMLTDDPGTGRVQIGDDTDSDEIPRDDVAAVLAAVLHEPRTAGKLFLLASGDDSIDEAIAKLTA